MYARFCYRLYNTRPRLGSTPCTPFKFFVEAGGLASYSADFIDIWRRAAVRHHPGATALHRMLGDRGAFP